MILLGMLMILSPIFVLVTLRIWLKDKLRVKILNTCIMALMLIIVFSLGDRQNELDKAESTLDYVLSRDTEYLDCVAKYKKLDDGLEFCIFPNIELLTKTYSK